MGKITTVGLDLAKNVFQVHAIDGEGKVVIRRRLRRGEVMPFFEQLPRCLVGLEACASSHHWARAIAGLGHTVKLMPPAYVKPYVKRGKTDAADAEAICEAVTRPTMRFVAIKTEAQQATLMLHKIRDLLVRQRTMLINALRGHLTEYGIVSAQGAGGVRSAIEALHEDQESLPMLARFALHGLVKQLRSIEAQIEKIEDYDKIGLDEGAQLLIGGERTHLARELAGGYYYQPTVLKGHNQMRVFQEEIFGPVLAVTTFKDEPEALALANDTLYGLGAGVWTRDMSRAYRMGRSIKAGRVWTNCYHLYPAHAAFGGYKVSGVGRENHRMMLEHYSQTKCLLVSYDPKPLGFF